MMSRKHYIAIADALASVDFSHKAAVVYALCRVFRDDNPRFDANRFKEAVNRKE